MTGAEEMADTGRPPPTKMITMEPPRGMRDILPDEAELRDAAARTILGVYRRFGFRRIESFLERTGPGQPTEVPAAFAAAMDDDLGTPAAMAVLFDTVRGSLSTNHAERR